jgi:ABC-2 type transport system ATP-binding protein
MAAIEVRELVKRYRGAAGNAVDGVSFDVPEGQLFCLLGPNGAGKSTTVSILTTTLSPTSGRARIGGRDVTSEQAAVRREVGIVFQQPALDLNLTAEENLRLHVVLYGLYPWRPSYRLMPAAYRRQVQELAGVLGIGDTLDHRIYTLSGGMRRKLEIVRALMHRPRVLFLDEPTTGLDPQSRHSLWRYVQQMRSRCGTTVFLTTHYLEEAEAADMVCVLVAGQVREHGSPSQLKARFLRPELVLDAPDRVALRHELLRMGLSADGKADDAAPLRVPLGRHSAQSIVRGLATDLTLLQIVQPTLEDTYLSILDRARCDGAGA